MKQLVSLSLLGLFATTSAAAETVPANQSHLTRAATEVQQAQDSANGSMTNTNLSGQVEDDTSQLSTGTTSGTTQGAIIDHTSKKKVKKKKKHSASETIDSTESGSTTSGGVYGNEKLGEPTTTEGQTPNDEIGTGVNGVSH